MAKGDKVVVHSKRKVKGEQADVVDPRLIGKRDSSVRVELTKGS